MKEYTYKIVGVTFKTEDGKSRQKNIKTLFDAEINEEFQDLTPSFEEYEYEGEPALRVYLDGVEVGNIAAEKVEDVKELAEKADGIYAEVAVNGVSPDDVRDAKDTIRNKRSLIKDGIITEWDVDDAEDLLEEIKEEPIYSATVTFCIKEPEDGIQRPAEVPEPMTKREAKRRIKEARKEAKKRIKEERKTAKAEKKAAKRRR